MDSLVFPVPVAPTITTSRGLPSPHPDPPPTEEEAAGSEVDAKAEEFIQGFKEDLRQQRLKSIFNYTQMLKRRVAAGRPAAAP